MAKKAKTADELMKEAEALQKAEAPELYQDEPTTSAPEPGAAPAVEPETPPETPPEPEPPAPKETPPPVEDLEALRAKLKAVEDELAKEKSARRFLSDRDKKLNQAHDEIEGLKKRLAEVESRPEPKPAPVEDLTRKKLVEKYEEGSEAVQMYDTLKAEIKSIDERINTSLKTVDEKVKTVDERAMNADERAFLGELKSKVPDWEDIVKMPEFVDYLQFNKVPYTEISLLDRLRDAAGERDVENTANIYKAFKETLPKATSVPSEPPTKKDKEKLLSPSTTPKSESTLTEIESFTPDEMQKLLMKITDLKSKGRLKEAATLEAKKDAFLESLGTF
jgi:hypothetical protein